MIRLRTDLPIRKDAATQFLPWIVAVMVFLATLAMAGAFAVQNIIDRWDRDVSGTLTVQILPAAGTPEESASQTDWRVEKALEVLRQDPAVEVAEAIPVKKLRALMEPWLGSTELAADLPMPRLIDVTLRSRVVFDLEGLSERLTAEVPGASLDDHRLWLNKLIGLASALGNLAYAVLALVAAAAALAVVQATKSGLVLHRPAIEVLHLIGAQDDYIARQFARRAMALGLKGGVLGFILAMPAILGVGYLASDIEGGFVPEVTLGVFHWIFLVFLPVVAGLLAMISTRLTVLRTLARML